LRRIAPYASVVAPRRLASDASLAIRIPSKSEAGFGGANWTVDLERLEKVARGAGIVLYVLFALHILLLRGNNYGLSFKNYENPSRLP
jgi:hypothetical protein